MHGLPFYLRSACWRLCRLFRFHPFQSRVAHRFGTSLWAAFDSVRLKLSNYTPTSQGHRQWSASGIRSKTAQRFLSPRLSGKPASRIRISSNCCALPFLGRLELLDAASRKHSNPPHNRSNPGGIHPGGSHDCRRHPGAAWRYRPPGVSPLHD